MLIDEVKLKIKAGDGGNGIVHFYRDRHRPKGGPDGGNGGDGGSVYFEAVSDIMALKRFRYEKKFEAEGGNNGGLNQKTGKNGDNLILKVPIGSIIYYDNGTSIEMSRLGEVIIATKGGKGGRGNYSYRGAANRQPKEFDYGQKREWKKIRIELKLIADVGLVGLPNAGKSSLLNELTNAKAKVANYPFTTLEPNLGVTKGGKVIADIPGLIEGASGGKGLGVKFLKHVERTKLILHCISCESQNLKEDYETVRNEINNYSSKLSGIKEYVILTKTDLIDDKKVIDKLTKEVGAKMAVSIIDEPSLKKLSDFIHKKLSAKKSLS